MSPSVRLVASILALTVLGGCSFQMGAAPPISPPPAPAKAATAVNPAPSSNERTPSSPPPAPAPAEATTEVNPAPSSNERTPSSRASWVPAHWEVQGRSKTWVDGHWG